MMVTDNRHTILLVDDEDSILNLLKTQLQQDYQVLTATDGKKALAILKASENPVTLIISDQNMPEMTGAQFLEKAKTISPDSMRFLMTGYSDMNAIIDALNKGEIHRYLTKPFEYNDLLVQIRQAVEHFELVAENRSLLEQANRKNEALESKVMERSKGLIEKYEQLKASRLEVEQLFEDTIHLLSKLVDMINPELGLYMKQVSRLSRKIASAYNLEEHVLKQIEISGLFHDLGLLGLPEIIFSKDEISMNETEYGLFSQHPAIASISCNHIPKLKYVSQNIYSHHENFDGSGYPDGMKGQEIPLGARIVAPVSDYCRIINTWPMDIKKIKARFEQNFGPKSAEVLNAENAEKMLGQAAEKALDFGKNKKYDPEIVEKLKKQVADEKRIEKNSKWVSIDELEEGMMLEKQICLKDGKRLLSRGLVFNEPSIKSLQELNKSGKIDSKVCISA